MRRLLLALVALLALEGWYDIAHAQQIGVQQTATRFDAGTNVGFTQAAVGSSSVVTITPPGGQYVYLTGIGIDVCQNGTGAAITNLNVTSTGIVGTPSWSFSSPSALNTCAVGSNSGGVGLQNGTTVKETFAVPLRSSAPGTNVVLTSPTTAQVQYTIRAYYYVGPGP
jgi:hypothetical protein